MKLLGMRFDQLAMMLFVGVGDTGAAVDGRAAHPVQRLWLVR